MGWTPSLRRTSLLSIFLIVAANLSFVLPAAATGIPLGQDDLLEDIGQYSPPWFAELQDVEMVGNRAYVFGVGGLAIFDISNPQAPLELGRYEPIGHPYNRFYRGAVDGNVACGGGRGDLLTIIDVSIPAVPSVLSFHGTAGQSYEGAAMQGGYIFACCHGDGLEIVDITTPTLPTVSSQVKTLTNAWDVELSGNYAYVADGLGGLGVIDITNPALPVHVTSVPASGSAVDVAIDGTTAVVSVGSAGLDIYDLTNPAAPLLVSTINTSGLAITAAIAGNLVYVADWDDVEVFDLSNPAAPVLVGGEDTPVRAMGLDARPDLVVVADWSRLRLYSTGPSTRGDIHVPVESIDLGFVTVGSVVDTTFALSNTGNAPINVTSVQDFGANFQILTPGPFVIPAGGAVDITIRFNHLTAGFESTFIRIDSDDSDEAQITFPISADDDPIWLDIGNPAPNWTHLDMDGVFHQLADQKGRIVVMAFFANW